MRIERKTRTASKNTADPGHVRKNIEPPDQRDFFSLEFFVQNPAGKWQSFIIELRKRRFLILIDKI